MIAPRRWMSLTVLVLALVVTVTPAQGQTGGLPAVQARVQVLEEQVAALEAALEQLDTTPAGAVMFFNLATCPAGWTELASARGRYLVGLPSGGTLAQEVGTALTAGEDRPVGQHAHAVTDPGHSHTVDYDALLGNNSGVYRDYVSTDPSGRNSTLSTRSSTTGITVQTAGTVAGTNAPYLQLQVCEKQ